MSYIQPTRASSTSTQVPYYGSPFYVSGLHLEHLSANQIGLARGSCRSYGSNWNISIGSDLLGTNGYLNLDTTTVGPQGCYPVLPSEAAPTDNTSFGVYLLDDTSGGRVATAVIATGDDFLIDGYDTWCRVGMVQFEGGTNNLVFMAQTGNGLERNYHLQSAIPIVVGGAATGPALVDFTSGDAPCHPDFNTGVLMSVRYTPTGAGNVLQMALSTAPSPAVWPIWIQAPAAGNQMGVTVPAYNEINSGLVSLYYQTTAGTDVVDIYLAGFSESLGLGAL